MATNSVTLAQRYQLFMKAVRETSDAVFDTTGPQIAARAMTPKCFEETASGEQAASMGKSLQGSLLKGAGDADVCVYGFIPATHATKRMGSVQQVKVVSNGTSGQFMTEGLFMERYQHIIAGVLTVDGKSGMKAGTVTQDGAIVRLTPVTSAGNAITQLRVDVGGVTGAEAPTFDIEEVVVRFGLRWVAVEGEEAQDGTPPLRAELQELVGTGALGATRVLNGILTGGDALTCVAMQNIGLVPSQSGSLPASALAQYLAVLADEREKNGSLLVCLAELAKAMGEDLRGGGQGDALAAAAGQKVVETLTTVVMGLDNATLRTTREHAFPNGLTIGDDSLPPGEVAAYVHSIVEKLTYT